MKNKKFNIFEFLNSCDVREYLESINYQFSSLEAAVIVCHSNKKSLAEKDDAWRTIIETMPDCEVPATEYEKSRPSLHEFLKSCIDDNMLTEKSFFSTYPAAFTYSYREPTSGEWRECKIIFRDLESLLKDIKETYSEVIPMDKSQKKQRYHIERFTVRRQDFPDKDGDVDVWLADFYKGKIVSCQSDLFYLDPQKLARVPISIPTPFKSGDILTLQKPDYHHEQDFVLYCMPNWQKSDFEKNGINYEKDITNEKSLIDIDYGKFKQAAYGYFVNDNGEVYHQHPGPYFDFEYCKKPLYGKLAILKPISEFLKGGKGLEYLLNMYTSKKEGYAIQRRHNAGFETDEEE